MTDINKYKININCTIREALKIIDACGNGLGIVVDKLDNVVGIITDGDFRRSVLKGVDLNGNVLEITNKKFTYLLSGYEKHEAISLFDKFPFEYLLVLNNRKLDSILKKGDILVNKQILKKYNSVIAPVVIMAGGKGTRMDPFTRILPKPLIPIGDKSMIEIIMEEYEKYGMKNFYISVFYKANMIKSYLEYIEGDYTINYIDEEKPLGTGGALKYLEGKINSPFFVSNCDIIIKDDYSKIYDFHKNGDFALTIVTSMQHVKIPYGVCNLSNNGRLEKIVEKPEFDFLINTGMYLLNPETLSFIPNNTFFNITDLIQVLLDKDLKIGVYPVSEKSYIDVGQWAEYKKAIENLI